MPLVQDPNALTYLINTPFGPATVTAEFNRAYNDLWQAWHGLTKQFEYVLPRRLNLATSYRAHYKKAVAL